MVMSSHLERAIKELAAALEESQAESSWELVRESSAEPRASTDLPCDSGKSEEKPGGQTKEKSVVTPSGPTGSVIAYYEDVRHYVVVEHPIWLALVLLHGGP